MKDSKSKFSSFTKETSEKNTQTPEVPVTPNIQEAVTEDTFAATGNPAFHPAMRLVRCRIYNLDPKKADIPGEIITVANSQIGTVRKFIPFGEQTENGYHVPHIIFEELKNRKFLSIAVKKARDGGSMLPEERWVPEFNIEVLPPLTEEELEELAKAQKNAG